VQRIQRFAQSSLFKRGVFQLIAEELLARPGAMAALAASASQSDLRSLHSAGSAGAMQGERSEDGGSSVHSQGGAAAGGLASQPSFSSKLLSGIAPGPDTAALRELYRKLHFDAAATAVDRSTAEDALGAMGFRLMPCEASQLVETMDTSRSGKVRRSAFAASQIDWGALQRNDVRAWIEIARRAFSSLDKDKDGGERARAVGSLLCGRFVWLFFWRGGRCGCCCGSCGGGWWLSLGRSLF